MTLAETPQAASAVATFRLVRGWYGIDAGSVREILPRVALTRIPLATREAAGVFPLRGRIVDAIDLRCVIDPEFRERRKRPRDCPALVLQIGSDLIGLIVDQLGDVAAVPLADRDPPPVHLAEHLQGIVTGTVRVEHDLVTLLDPVAALPRS